MSTERAVAGERPIARDAGVVMALILLSRLLGFVRERAIADVFGISAAVDAFRLAFLVPDFMYYLLIAGGLNAAFVPVFTEYLARNEEDEAWKLARTFFAVIVTLLLAMVALGVFFTPLFSPLVAYEYRGAQRALLNELIRLMFPAVFFTALAGVGMGVHKAYKSFSAPMWGPIAYNASIIASTYTLGRTAGIFGMAYGTVAGAIINFLVQVPFVWKKAARRAFTIDFRHRGLARVFRLMGPAVISLSIYQLNFMIVSNLASGLEEGSPTALRLAQTVVQLPLGVFAMAIGMVILPSLSRLAALNRSEEFLATFSSGIRAVTFITIPCAVGLAVLRVPVVRLLFETGAFSAEDTQMTAHALLFFSLGLWAQSAIQVLTQVFYSLQATRTLVGVSAVALVVQIALSIGLLRFTPFGHGALALSLSLTTIINMLNYLVVLRRRLGRIDGGRILRTVVFSTAAALLMGGAVSWIASMSEPWFDLSGMAGQAGHVALAVVSGALVYGLIAVILRMEELAFIRGMIRRTR